MYLFVTYVFIFSMGALAGWGLEVIYRHIADPEKRWFNPGFCVGPWLPIYGVGLLTVYVITHLENVILIGNPVLQKVILFAIMAICMTIIELIAGIILLRFFNLRLWDYRNEKFNYKGFICLKFSIFWMLLSAGYYFLLHPRVNDQVLWLSKNLIFSFVIGLVFGVFAIDLIYSANVIARIKKMATDSGVIVKLEEIKEKLNQERKKEQEKEHFFVFMLKENIDKLIKPNKIQETNKIQESNKIQDPIEVK